MNKTIAFLGPAGSYHSHVADFIAGEIGGEPTPVYGVAELVKQVSEGQADFGVLAVETNLCGMIESHLTAFLNSGLKICAEVPYEAFMVLAAPPGTSWDDIKTVHSHPEALAECRNWIQTNLPGRSISFASTTSAAAEEVAATIRGHAVICSPEAAERFGFVKLAEDVCDSPGDQTKFWIIGRTNTLNLKPTTATYLIAPSATSWGRSLSILCQAGDHISKLDSLTLRQNLGQYALHVDFRTGGASAHSEVISRLREISNVRELGHYKSFHLVPSAESSQARPGRNINRSQQCLNFVAAQQCPVHW